MTQYQLFDFQRNFRVVHERGAGVASVVRQVFTQKRAFIPHAGTQILHIQERFAALTTIRNEECGIIFSFLIPNCFYAAHVSAA